MTSYGRQSGMSISGETAARRYDLAAPRWGDKMRTLGYFDAYLGLFSQDQGKVARGANVVDIGAGTAAFSEAWVTINGAPSALTLLDPSREMLARGSIALRRHGIDPRLLPGLLGEIELEPADVVLAAHVIEHCPDPAVALSQMFGAVRPGGRLYLVVSKPHWCNAIIWLQWRHRTFGREEILKLVRAAGFTVDRTYSFPAGPPSRTSQAVVATRAH